MNAAFRTALIGCGKVGLGYPADPLTARFYSYVCHAQALNDHPAFVFDAVVDPNPAARALAVERWGVRHAVPRIEDLMVDYDPEVIVIATPPEARLEIVAACPHLRAVLCEKPLAPDWEKSVALIDHCRSRGIALSVNLWRRCDPLFRRLVEGELNSRIGIPHGAFAIYGNGVRNNGLHIIDMARMFFGEVVWVQATGSATICGALSTDADISATLAFSNNRIVFLLAVDFEHYREVGLDVWGDQGRLTVLNEGLSIFVSPCAPNRAVSGAREIDGDGAQRLESTVGEALYHVYDDLADHLMTGAPLKSSGDNALRSSAVVEAVVRSASSGGIRIPIEDR